MEIEEIKDMCEEFSNDNEKNRGLKKKIVNYVENLSIDDKYSLMDELIDQDIVDEETCKVVWNVIRRSTWPNYNIKTYIETDQKLVEKLNKKFSKR